MIGILLFILLNADINAFSILTVDQLFHDNNEEQLIGKEIQLKGFLYPFGEDHVLSSKPNLKSCCIGPANRHQILVKQLTGEQMNHIAVLQGFLLRSNEGNQFLFVNAKRIQENKTYTHWITIVMVLGIFTMISYLCLKTNFIKNMTKNPFS